MPDITTYADTFRTWRGLIGASVQYAEKVPGVEPFKADLEASLARAEELKTQQETLESARLEATKSFAAVLQEGKEKVRKLQAFVISVLGSRSELLKQFGLVPNRLPRPRSRKASKQPAPAGAQPANPAVPEAATVEAAPAGKPGL